VRGRFKIREIIGKALKVVPAAKLTGEWIELFFNVSAD
jgi:hypothetical protein